MPANQARSASSSDVAFFEALRPARQICTDQLRQHRPFGPHYHMICVIISAMDAAAEFFTKQRSYYTVSQQPDMIGRQLPHART